MKNRLLWIGMILLLSAVFLLPTEKMAISEPALEEWNRVQEYAKRTLDAVDQRDYTKAKAVLLQMDAFVKDMQTRYAWDQTQSRAFKRTLDAVREALSKPAVEHAQARWQSVRLHLAADALVRSQQPLWKTYSQTFQRQLTDVESLLQDYEPARALQTAQINYRLFETMAPAISVSGSDVDAEAMKKGYDRLFAALESTPPDRLSAEEQVRHLKGLAENAFQAKKSTSFKNVMIRPAPIVLIGLVAAHILPVLFFVAWKKYTGETRRRREHS